MSDELKPCPFCGGEAAMESGRYELDDGMYAFAHVECLSCGACGSGFTDAEKPVEEVELLAADAWNRRAERTCRWELVEGTLFATECGEFFHRVVPDDYCPNCGAKVIE